MPQNRKNVKEYSYADAQQAMRVIAALSEVPYKAMAKRIYFTEAKFAKKIEAHTEVMESGNRFGMAAKPAATTYGFLKHEVRALSLLLGKACGYEDGFHSVEAMIAYAQERAPELEWQRSDYPTQEQETLQAEQIPKIPEYRLAAQLLVQRSKKSIAELMPDLQHASNVINNTQAAQALKPVRKLAILQEVATALGKRHGYDEFTLDQMLQEAQLWNPEAFIEVRSPQVQKLAKDHTRAKTTER